MTDTKVHMHTPLDELVLEAAGKDPDTVQHRERAVPCQRCNRSTWNVAACCDTHYEPPAAIKRGAS